MPQAQWFDSVILGPLAETMAETLKTGMLVTFAGHTTQRSWPAMKDGEPVTYTDEKSGETRQAWQHAAQLVVDTVYYTASDGLYYQVVEQDGEVVATHVAKPAKADVQQANIVLKGAASSVQMTAATATSQARLNFSLTEIYTKWSGAAATQRHQVTMWGNQAVLAHAEMQEGDKVTVLGAFSPNSYTDRLGIYQQGYNITCRQLDNYGQKQQAANKVAAPQAQQQIVAAMPASKARASKAARVALAAA